MEERESRRTCKTVNYAETMGDSPDDDFAIFTPPSKKQKEDCEKSPKTNGNREKTCDRDKKSREKKEKRDHKDHKHDREKHRDHNRDKKEKYRDSDKNKHEKNRYKEGHSKEKHREHERERKSEYRSKHETDREKKDGRQEKDKKHDSERRIYKENQDKIKSERSGDPIDNDLTSPRLNDHPLTSTQKSPGRVTPKPRLTIEEKLFQRELEAALAVSKLETTADSVAFKDKLKEKELKVGTSMMDQASSRLPNVNNTPKTTPRTSPDSNSPMNHNAKEETTSPSSSQDESLTGEKTDNNLLEVEKLEKDEKLIKINKNEDPLPSTSTGITSKRQRKTVVFKEDTDSDSFDGFNSDRDANSDFSEGSDFTISPVKKKGKQARASRKNKSPASKATGKTQGKSRVTGQNSTPTRTVPASAAKENTAPQSPSTPKALEISSTVSPHRSPTVVKAKAVNSTTVMLSPHRNARENSQVVKTSKTVSSPTSTGNSRVSVGLVKTPFKSPLLQSPGSSSSSSVPKSSLGANQNTGLRIGLSRRTSLKPLHPSLSGK
ncbi:uncharacterized protein [Panulirus ornatus]|uniref:uncharacterized protein n=1 Tax=Panulirus ornatus TaxID=150431 RepID=UPI003A839421